MKTLFSLLVLNILHCPLLVLRQSVNLTAALSPRNSKQYCFVDERKTNKNDFERLKICIESVNIITLTVAPRIVAESFSSKIYFVFSFIHVKSPLRAGLCCNIITINVRIEDEFPIFVWDRSWNGAPCRILLLRPEFWRKFCCYFLRQIWSFKCSKESLTSWKL